jgi:imidazolonepropionase-like amidohydrolase
MIRIFIALLCVCMVSSAVAEESVTVFVNVNVVPMSTEVVLKQQTVVVEKDKIIQMGHVDSVPVPKGAVVIDGTDRFLMPGLAEMHAHVTSTAPRQFDRLATLFVANGVTTIRGMLGRPDHLILRDQLDSGAVFGPRLITSGPSVNGRSVNGAADASRFVREQHAAGYDFVKIHPGPNADEFAAVANTANELGIPFAGHVPVAAGVGEALKAQMATIDHLDGYFLTLLPSNNGGEGGFGGFFDVMLAADLDADKIPAIVAATAAAGTWNVVTEVLIEQIIDTTSTGDLRQRPEMRFIARSVIDDWVVSKERQLADRDFNPETAALAIELRRRIILQLHEAGAGLLLGSDAPQVFNVPGYSLHRELKVLVEAGLTPYEALRTGTVAVAEFLDANTGIVAKGRAADLILLNANPLADIGNSDRIHGVMLRGQWLPASELEARLKGYEVANDG